MIDFSASLAGMNAAADMVNSAAARLANPAAPQADGLANDIVSLSAGKIAFETNAKAIQVQNEMAQSSIDLMG